MGETRKLCPSARCSDGNILLGIVNRQGKIDFMPEKVVIDETFVEAASKGRKPEQRFRFSGPCMHGGCDRWRDNACSVARLFHEEAPRLLHDVGPSPLPNCSIRPDCRWHSEHGDEICVACVWVITERDAGNVDG
jgi:hypothetical protein